MEKIGKTEQTNRQKKIIESLRSSIKEHRVKHNITQQELANMVGVSRQTINSIEAERYVPSTILAIKISHVFNMSVNELFQLDEDD